MRLIIILLLLFPLLTLAAPGLLVDRQTVSQWGYRYLHSNLNDYRKIFRAGQARSIRTITIKSKKPVRGYRAHYHYYLLSEECYDTAKKAAWRLLAIGGEKDYRKGFLRARCAYIMQTSANMSIWNEWTRVFRLFQSHINKQ